MSFYENISLECVNAQNFYPWPLPQDLDIATRVSQHTALTSIQLQQLGYSSRTLGKLVKKGVLYRYRVNTPEGSLPSIYTVGHTAQVIARLPAPRFPRMRPLRDVLMINQVIVSILQQTTARVDVDIRRPVQNIIVNNPMGLLVGKDLFYPKLPLRFKLNQAIVILPNAALALPDLPFRYVLMEELDYKLFDIRYYYCNQPGQLVPVNISFERQDSIESQIEVESKN